MQTESFMKDKIIYTIIWPPLWRSLNIFDMQEFHSSICAIIMINVGQFWLMESEWFQVGNMQTKRNKEGCVQANRVNDCWKMKMLTSILSIFSILSFFSCQKQLISINVLVAPCSVISALKVLCSVCLFSYLWTVW